ncbi:Protein-glutamate O-methyltransferase C1393.13 [Neonectria ditissima]|uniref:Sugar phosphate phosphatase n=1 Tax=Neonectria ditissima TaxID=78410 RepID=A0A0P7ADS3_9HYPO|nr:Protein-glutamate O-methyltransferase C1393.13 [Neonectria ditissima]
MDGNSDTPPSYLTSDKTAFAYASAHHRWASILASAIERLQNSASDCQESAKREEGLEIAEKLNRLKDEVRLDQQLSPVDDDGESDVELFNHQLEKLGPLTWYNLPWLYGDCYLYRRINSYFRMSLHWNTYDIFFHLKLDTFRSSRAAVVDLAKRYHGLVETLAKSQGKVDPKGQEQLFYEMCEMSLWGNATDLSLLTDISYEDIQKLQSSEALKNKESILVNDLHAVFTTLQEARSKGKKERRIDIVLDNAGFELYVDLILASYLISSGMATRVVIHPKSIPWFVSDTLPGDIDALFQILANPRAFYEVPPADGTPNLTAEALTEDQVDHLTFLAQAWDGFRTHGNWEIRANRVWTHPSSFWRLPDEDPALFEDLKRSECVIFKGDLNYRKLTNDAAWDPTTPFTKAIGPLGPDSGMNVLTLRTCKADVVVGLERGVDEKLRAAPGGGGDSGRREWAWSGKWAVCSFSRGH